MLTSSSRGTCLIRVDVMYGWSLQVRLIGVVRRRETGLVFDGQALVRRHSAKEVASFLLTSSIGPDLHA